LPPLNRTYKCSDGRYLFLLCGVQHRRFAEQLLQDLDLLTLFPADTFVSRSAYEGAFENNLQDPSRWSESTNRTATLLLSGKFATRPASYWETLLASRGLPVAMCRTMQEWLDSPHAKFSLIDTEGVVRVSEIDDDARKPVSLKQETEWKLPLHGIRVLDLSSVLAGPACGRGLADLGAHVIKVDPPVPLFGPTLGSVLGVDVNRGKKSMLLDLKSPSGRGIFERLLAESHVLVHNHSDRAAENLGLDLRSLSKVKSGIIVCRLRAYAAGGPWSARKGFDPVVQAATGIQVRYGGTDAPKIHGMASTLDYLTGYCAAFGILLGLYNAHAGRPQVVDTSLEQVSFLVQSAAHCIESGDSIPAQRHYHASDGWLCVIGRRTELEALDVALSPTFQKRSVVECLAAVRDYGLVGYEIVSVTALRRSSLMANDGVFSKWNAAGFGQVHGPGVRTFCESVPSAAISSAPRLGADTRPLLTTLGYGSPEIERLISQRVVSEGYPAF